MAEEKTIYAPILLMIVDAARRFASADNSQPIKFEVIADGKTGALLSADERHTNGFSDQQGFLTYIAMGTALENIQQQADFLGLTIEITPQPVSSRYPHGAFQIDFINTAEAFLERGIAPVIANRFTERSINYVATREAFDGQQFQELISPLDCSITMFEKKKNIRRSELLKIAGWAEELRFQSKQIHAEMMGSIDFSDSPQNEEKLSMEALRLIAPDKAALKFIRDWKKLKLLNALGLFKMLGSKGAKQPLAKSPLILGFSTQSYGAEDLLKAGQALQRLWLKATELDLFVHPYAAIGTMSSNHFTFEGKLEQKRLKVMSGAKYLLGSNAPLLLLRVGQCPKAKAPAHIARRSIESFIVSKDPG